MIYLKDILLNENITLPINVGDVLLGGKFRNKKIIVKDIGTDEIGQPTINGKKLLSFRILKLMPKKEITKEDLIYIIDQKLKKLLK